MQRRITEMATSLPLPDDLVVNVLLRLPIRSLMRCKCVCKSWRDLTTDSLFQRFHHTQSLANPSLILNYTVYKNSFSRHNQLQFVEHHDCDGPICSRVRLRLPDFSEFAVIGSCNGLLCLVHGMDRQMVSVCNPFTGEWGSFPSSTKQLLMPRRSELGFGFSPKTNEYKVVELVRDPYEIGIKRWEAFVWTLGHGSWRRLRKCCSGEAINFRWTTNAFVNGALHWICLTDAKIIVTFDVADEVFGEMTPPQTGERSGHYTLGVLSGCLAITKNSISDAEVWVMKDGGVKDSWTKCYSISFLELGWTIGYLESVCLWKDGEILLSDYESLLSYDPKTMRLRTLNLPGRPSWFQAVIHAATLVR